MYPKFSGTLVVVDDIQLSTEFYDKILGQKLVFDFGACKQFENGLTLQTKDQISLK